MERKLDRPETSDKDLYRKRKRLLTCLQRISKIIMLLSVTLLVFIYLQQGDGFHEKQITRPADLPRRFFPSHSHVTDYMFGSLHQTIKLLEDEELIFVMYYAPWCAQSIHIRNEFIRAAKVLSNMVKFVGINCWHPSGECRQRMKFLTYPELFVYHTGVLDGYRFTGIKESEYMVKFAESFLYPIQPLYTERQINEFSVQSDNTVIGYFDLNSSPQPPGAAFQQFYLAALRVTSYNFYQPVKFGLVQSSTLSKFLDLSSPGRLVLARVGNTTLKYPLFFNMTAKNITSWILTHKQKSLSAWLVPPGVKSLTMSVPMQQGPAVFVFGPVNPLVNTNPYLDMVRLASFAYRSCGNYTDYFQRILTVYLQYSYTNLHSANQYHTKCLANRSSVLSNSNLSSLNSKCCMSMLTGSRKFSQKSICEYCVQKKTIDSDTVCDIDFRSEGNSDLPTGLLNSCSDFYRFYNVNEHHSLCCKDSASALPNLHVKQSHGAVRRSTDSYVINGENLQIRNYFSKLSLQKTKHLTTLQELSNALTRFNDINSRAGNFTGLQCKTNKTVNFYFLDSVYHSDFMEKFHIKVPQQSSKTSAVLVDMKDEAVYVHKQELNYRNLAKFVEDYTVGKLSRYQRSSEVSTPTECHTEPDSVCILEVTAETFQQVVMDKYKDVLLLYYSHWCGFCALFSQAFLATAQYFKGQKDLVFARINADLNDLPWEFTVETFPSLIFFPAYRKSDSVMFPNSKAKTVPNLIKFILHHSNFSLQVDSAVKMCSSECVNKNRRRILHRIDELESSVKQLERRNLALASQRPLTEAHKTHIEKTRKAVHRERNIKNFKLHKAQILNHFLQSDWKKLDKTMIMNFISANRGM